MPCLVRGYSTRRPWPGMPDCLGAFLPRPVETSHPATRNLDGECSTYDFCGFVLSPVLSKKIHSPHGCKAEVQLHMCPRAVLGASVGAELCEGGSHPGTTKVVTVNENKITGATCSWRRNDLFYLTIWRRLASDITVTSAKCQLSLET